MTKPIIGYIRVSTKQQGESGLGLEGQELALNQYSKSSEGRILKTYREVETGKRADRPELERALAHSRRSGATLVIAKLDRLARNVHFVSGLMESGVDFVACDNPHANKLTIHILAAIAEHEAEQISARTKEALAAYKARGGVLGAARPGAYRFSRDDALKGGDAARKVAIEETAKAYADIAPQIIQMRQGGMTQQAIADWLNTEGHTTRRGRAWTQGQVSQVLAMFKVNYPVDAPEDTSPMPQVVSPKYEEDTTPPGLGEPSKLCYNERMNSNALSRLKAHMAAGEYQKALKLAASWKELGEHKERITRGWTALLNPAIYKQMGQDPDALAEEGIRAIRERYGLE